ncbi:MAG: PhoU family transcriptional regulator, partial [Candidatus Bathyarchaeia archaeon]
SLFRKDYTLADDVVSKAESVTSLEENAIKEVQTEIAQADLSSIRIIMESLRRTAEYASDIAEVVLNLNVAQIIAT